MSRSRDYLIAALVVAALLLGLERALRTDSERRNWEFFTEMAYSVAAESFSHSVNLPGGLTQQGLVPEVVPRGGSMTAFGAGPDEALRAGRELAQPLAVDDETVSAGGRELYGIYCAICHDATGEGRGLVVERGMPPPASLHGERARSMADGQMYHVLTHGQGTMGSYGSQLDVQERWAVVSHVRSLQARRNP